MNQLRNSAIRGPRERAPSEPLFPDQPFGFMQGFVLRKDFVLPSVHPKKIAAPPKQASSCPCAECSTSRPNPITQTDESGSASLKRQRCNTSTLPGCECEGAKCTFLTCTCPHRTTYQKTKNIAQTLTLAGMIRLGRNSPASILATNALVLDYFVDTFLVGSVTTPPLYMSLCEEKYAITSTNGGTPTVAKLHYCTRVIGSAGRHKTVGFMTEAECKVAVWDHQKSFYPKESFDVSASTTDKFICNAQWLVGYSPRTHTITIWSLIDKHKKCEFKCTENMLSMQIVERSSGHALKLVTSVSSLSTSSVITIAEYSLPNASSGPTGQPLTKDIGDLMEDEAEETEIHSLHLLEGARYIIASRMGGTATVLNSETLDVVGKVRGLRSVIPVGGCSFATLETGVVRLYRIDSGGIEVVKELDNVADCTGADGILFVKQAFGNKIEAFSGESGESLWTLAPDVSRDFRGGQYIRSFPL